MNLPRALMLSALALLNVHCSQPKSPLQEGMGTINIRLNIDLNTLPGLSTPLPPDLRAFTLDVLQANQVIQHFSPLGDAARNIHLETGLYELHCYSAPFTTPAFDTPVYGARESVRVVAGSTVTASINCAQTNSGVNIVYSDRFQAAHSTYSTRIIQGGHSLNYVGNDLLRTGYFLPENILLEVTADGQRYEETLRLNPRSIYTLTIQDDHATGGTKGDIQINISVSTDVIHEEIEITLPGSGGGDGDGGDDGGNENSDKLPYFENMGNTPVSNLVLASLYTGWQSPDVQHSFSPTNTPMMQSSRRSIGYADCSGGNSLSVSKNGYFEISGLETAGYRDLTFSFGCCRQSGQFDPTELIVSVSSDGVNYTPLEYISNEEEAWELITIDTDIPACNNLHIRMQATTTMTIYIDDLHVNGVLARAQQ